jgi:hypothetical protein
MEPVQRASLDHTTKTERCAPKKHEREKTGLRNCRKSKHLDAEASFHQRSRKRIREAPVRSSRPTAKYEQPKIKSVKKNEDRGTNRDSSGQIGSREKTRAKSRTHELGNESRSRSQDRNQSLHGQPPEREENLQQKIQNQGKEKTKSNSGTGRAQIWGDGRNQENKNNAPDNKSAVHRRRQKSISVVKLQIPNMRIDSTPEMRKSSFPLTPNEIYNLTTEVTTLPPSLIWLKNRNLFLDHS